MNWKPTTDTTSLSKALNKNNDSLIFDMFSDALLESGSHISMWDAALLFCCTTGTAPKIYNPYIRGSESIPLWSSTGNGNLKYTNTDFHPDYNFIPNDTSVAHPPLYRILPRIMTGSGIALYYGPFDQTSNEVGGCGYNHLDDALHLPLNILR